MSLQIPGRRVKRWNCLHLAPNQERQEGYSRANKKPSDPDQSHRPEQGDVQCGREDDHAGLLARPGSEDRHAVLDRLRRLFDGHRGICR